MVRCIVVPGRGTLDCKFEHWYGWLESRLNDTGLFDEVILPEMMPDPVVASEHEWVPFLRGLGVDEETVVVGHSSGAAAAMRLCERERVKALVLVCAYHTDLGDASEAAAGYFGRPWAWDRIRENAGRVVLFHDADDPHIPKAEARLVAGELKADYHELGARAASRHASVSYEALRPQAPLPRARGPRGARRDRGARRGHGRGAVVGVGLGPPHHGAPRAPRGRRLRRRLPDDALSVVFPSGPLPAP